MRTPSQRTSLSSVRAFWRATRTPSVPSIFIPRNLAPQNSQAAALRKNPFAQRRVARPKIGPPLAKSARSIMGGVSPPMMFSNRRDVPCRRGCWSTQTLQSRAETFSGASCQSAAKACDLVRQTVRGVHGRARVDQRCHRGRPTEADGVVKQRLTRYRDEKTACYRTSGETALPQSPACFTHDTPHTTRTRR